MSTIRQEITTDLHTLRGFFEIHQWLHSTNHKYWSRLRVVTTRDDMKLLKDHKEVRIAYRCMVIFTGYVRCEADLTTLLFLLFKQRTRNFDADLRVSFYPFA